MTQNINSRHIKKYELEQEFCRRLSNLLSDGYCLRHMTNTDTFRLARVKHMANGNEIIIKADFHNFSLTQKTNNVKTLERFF